MKSSLELQRALVAALREDAVLGARGIKLFDGPPADARPPYLSVGQDVVINRGWKGGGGTRAPFFSGTLGFPGRLCGRQGNIGRC